MRIGKAEPKPRIVGFMGMRSYPSLLNLGTWLEAEEVTYPNGGMIRRARAIDCETGRLKVVRCGIPDTFFSIPVRGGGYLDMSPGGALRFHPPKAETEEAR